MADMLDDPTDFLKLQAVARDHGITVSDNQNCVDLRYALKRLSRYRKGERMQASMISEMWKLQGPKRDTMTAHASADQLLCRLLTVLGFERVVKEWQKVDKFYG